jgi:dihydroorotate dehydrogenase electron transfer subunit
MEQKMGEKRKVRVVISEMTRLTADICSMWVEEKEMALAACAGQFVSLYSEDAGRLLPRPISICEIDKEKGRLRFVFRIVGKGTEEFSQKRAGDTIAVLGPLGNGYTLGGCAKEGEKALLFGGGIGIPPMLELAKQLKKSSVDVQAVLGYRDSQLFLKDELEKYAKVYISTEDGSIGTKGNVIDAVKENKLTADRIFACGPKPMLRGIKAFAQERNIPAQLSMEERMACGIGACLACVCESKDVDEHSHVKNKRICKDGPVFFADEIEL